MDDYDKLKEQYDDMKLKNLTFDEYQACARETAIYPDMRLAEDPPAVVTRGLLYTVLGLADETGEIAGKVKKIMRDKHSMLDETDVKSLKKELGDVCWYLAMAAYELDINLGDVAKLNVEKLASRKQRGVLGGSGDER